MDRRVHSGRIDRRVEGSISNAEHYGARPRGHARADAEPADKASVEIAAALRAAPLSRRSSARAARRARAAPRRFIDAPRVAPTARMTARLFVPAWVDWIGGGDV